MSTQTLPLPGSDQRPKSTAEPSDRLYEIVNGEQVDVPEMGIYSTYVASELFFLLRLYLQQNPIGHVTVEAMVILDAESNLRRRPDVCFVSHERWSADRPIPETGDWDVVPDLPIEVISPNDYFTDIHQKIDEYFRAGAREVWLVDPIIRAVRVFVRPEEVTRLTGDAMLKSESILPGFEVQVSKLFPPSIAPEAVVE